MRAKFLLGAAVCSLAFLIGCSTPSPSPSPSSSSSSAKHPTSCNKDPKKEPHFHDCNGNIYLPGHMPEECIPEEPEVVAQSPVEPPEPDPIVGTYRRYYDPEWGRGEIMRVYPNNKAKSKSGYVYRWKRENNSYHFYLLRNNEHWFSVNYTDVVGEPNLITFEDTNSMVEFEAIQLSRNPDHLFDFFILAMVRGDNIEWHCVNIGRKERFSFHRGYWWGAPPSYADSLEECEALCPSAELNGPCAQHETKSAVK